MAFTKTWNENEPDGAVITVSQLDDYHRDTKIAVRERLEGDPANALTGLLTTDTFAAGPIPKRGAARFYHGPVSGIGGHALQDGRGFFTSDAGGGHPKLYSMGDTGPLEIAYLNRDGSRDMSGILTVDVDHTASAGTPQSAVIAQQSTPAGAFTFTEIAMFTARALVKGAGSTITTLVGVRVEDMLGATNNYTIVTGQGQVLLCSHGATAYVIKVDASENVHIGKPGQVTSSTSGHVFIPSVAGVPTGSVVSGLSADNAAIVIDRTNFRIYVNASGMGWRFAQLNT